MMFLLVLSAFCAAPAVGQQQLVKAELLRKHEELRRQRLSRLHGFKGRISLRLPSMDDFLLVDITPHGVPIFKSPINANAAITTGVVKLQSGVLGLNLRGAGMLVGVWDAGKVDEHAELDTRVLFREDANLSQHATHVTGTILASGINPSVKGMAPSAKAITHYYNNDYEEMVNAVTAGTDPLIISNHSYGSLTGWFRSAGVWYWTGDPEISDKEDYRFGLYAHDAELIDLIANIAPYYTMVWAAGNDRWEVGNGAFPADGNQGTGYDCIIPEGVAKNNITIGAVDKVLNYNDASSVPMAFFSSWGPTDDGRIKPDLVADGMNVSSLNTGGTYLILSGTSMATPNVTGSLMLLQELYKKLHADQIMRSATLKALAIHTAKEAGDAPGPDYRFGWGLMDAEGAANVLLKEDGVNVFVDERTMANGDFYVIDLEPKPNTKIKVTIAWTDPAATPPGDLLDPETPMLVNDLDIRFVDIDGNEIFPWILDPAAPAAAATKGDNFRDNVEKIEVELAEDRPYQLVVSHKGILAGPQDYSLIITHESKKSTAKTFYWIGGNGNWNDGSHWSHTTGGAAANEIPTSADRVVIDENAFSGGVEEAITLDANAACGSLTWLTEKEGVLSMQGKRLSIHGNAVFGSSYFKTTTAGSFEFKDGGTVSFQDGDLGHDTLRFNGGSWVYEGSLIVSRLDVTNGYLKLPAATIKPHQLVVEEGATLDMNEAHIEDLELFVADNATLLSQGAAIIVSKPALFGWTAEHYDGNILVTADGSVSIYGDNTIDSLVVDGELRLLGANRIESLKGNPGAIISLIENQTQVIGEIDLMGNEEKLLEIRSMTPSNATIEYAEHKKVCFDYLKVVDIDILSASVFNAGAHSQVLGSEDWVALACDDVLFPDFVSGNACAHGLTIFIEQSMGPATSYEWNFGDPGSPSNTSSDRNVNHQFVNAGTYAVTLTISNATYSASYTTGIDILPNPNVNAIVQNGFVLSSQQPSEAYQWYRNAEPIDEAVNRTFVFEEPGSYQLLTTDGDCNYFTDEFIILGAEETRSQNFVVYPNPTADRVKIRFRDSGFMHHVALLNAVGQPLLVQQSSAGELELNVERLPSGVYIVDVDGAKGKVVVRR